MAWTTPATYTVGEVVTASKLNLHIRDNMRYLKGLDGAVNIESNLAVGATFTPAVPLHVRGNARFDGPAAGATNNVGFGFHDSNGVRKAFVGDAATGDEDLYLICDAGGVRQFAGGATRMFVGTTGRVGIGTTAPDGHFQVNEGAGGAAYKFVSNVTGSAQTILNAGAVTYRVLVMGVLRSTAGNATTVNTLLTSIAPGGATLDIGDGGGSNTYRFTCTAGGALQVQRVAGSNAADFSLWIIWY